MTKREKPSQVRSAGPRDPGGGAENGVARRIVDGDAQMQPFAGSRRRLGARDGGGEAVGQAVAAADDGEADAVAGQARRSPG